MRCCPKLELSEFMMMCRQEGYFDLKEIQTAVFECNGRLTILPVSEKRPVTPSDIHCTPKKEYLSTEIIMDGRILEENLKRMGLDRVWLYKQIKKQGYKNEKEIFLGICDRENNVSLYSGK